MVLLCALTPARADLNLSEWNNYAGLAEQGAICASFSALMESQSILNNDIGKLWQERRKFAGAVIRSAAEMELNRSPDSDEINLLVSTYSEWVLGALLQEQDPLSGLSDDTNSEAPPIVGPEQMQRLINEHCTTLFEQGDKQILDLNPELAYLLKPDNSRPLAALSTSQPMVTTPLTPSSAERQSDKSDSTTLTSTDTSRFSSEEHPSEPNKSQRPVSLKDKLASIVKNAGSPSKEPVEDLEKENNNNSAPSKIKAVELASTPPLSPPPLSPPPLSPNVNQDEREQSPKNILEHPFTPAPISQVQQDREQPRLPAPKKRPSQKPKPAIRVTSTSQKQNAGTEHSMPQTNETETTQAPAIKYGTKHAHNSQVAPIGQNVILAVPKQRTSSHSQYVAQLGSYSQARNAERARAKIQAEFEAIFDAIPLEVNEHTLASGRLFYRLETSPIDRKKAHYICDILWEVRLSCLLKQARL